MATITLGYGEFNLQDFYPDYDNRPASIPDVDVPLGGFRLATCGHGQDCPCMMDIESTEQAIVIASDGGLRRGVASIGVYVGEDSRFNSSEVVAEGTSQRAEYRAAIRAMQTMFNIKACGHLAKVGQVVLKTDFKPMVEVMVEGIAGYRWDDWYGYTNRRGRAIQDSDLIRELEEACARLHGEYGVEVLFWHVHRDYNKAADRLATMALDAEAAARSDGRPPPSTPVFLPGSSLFCARCGGATEEWQGRCYLSCGC